MKSIGLVILTLSFLAPWGRPVFGEDGHVSSGGTICPPFARSALEIRTTLSDPSVFKAIGGLSAQIQSVSLKAMSADENTYVIVSSRIDGSHLQSFEVIIQGGSSCIAQSTKVMAVTIQ
ncbi:MAG: hypothetical protein NTV34_16140 [Proteobacteria bacterium]|nr:hypothetical protein [Pseudomonadota bacterium]